MPCSHHDYDAVTTSRLLLQKWFARHGTPTRMQSDNAPNLTAEVSNEFLKAAHVTKVTSTASHPRTQGLVEAPKSDAADPYCEFFVPAVCAIGTNVLMRSWVPTTLRGTLPLASLPTC